MANSVFPLSTLPVPYSHSPLNAFIAAPCLRWQTIIKLTAQRQYLTLHELSKAIASHRNLSDLFRDLAARLHLIFDFEAISVMLHDESQNVMRLHILETSEPAFRQGPVEVPTDGSITGWVWRN